MRIIERYVGRSLQSKARLDILGSQEKAEKVALKPYEPIIPSSFKDPHKRKRISSTTHSESSSKRHKKSKKKKHKKEKKSKRSRSRSPSPATESSEDEQLKSLKKQKLERLRAERLAREKVEREKADKLLAKLRGDQDPEATPVASRTPSQQPRPVKQKYNSQFNPEIARQNFD